MQEGKFLVRLLGAAIALPFSGLMALGSAGAASALTCQAGYVAAVAGNGAEFCSPRNDGGVPGDGTATTGSGASTVPGQAAPIAGSNSGAPALPPVVAPAVPSAPPVRSSLPPAPISAIPPISVPEVPDSSPVKAHDESSDQQHATEQAPEKAGSDQASSFTPAPAKSTEVKVDVLPSPVTTIMAVPSQTAGAVPSPKPTGSVTQSINPDKSSSSAPFNPSGIYMGVLSGLLVVLVAALVTVLKSNKKLARK